MAFWGLIMEPGKQYNQTVEQSFHVSMATLDVTGNSADNHQVKLKYEGTQYLLCNLKAPTCCQIPLDLNFEKGSMITFSLIGKNRVHLTGYVLEDDDGMDFEDESAEEEEEEVPQLVNGNKRKAVLPKDNSKNKRKKVESESEEDSSDDDGQLNGLEHIMGSSFESDDADDTFNAASDDEDDDDEELEEEESDDEDELEEEEDESDDEEPEPVKPQKKDQKKKNQKQEIEQPAKKQKQQKVMNGDANLKAKEDKKEQKEEQDQKLSKKQKQKLKQKQEQEKQSQSPSEKKQSQSPTDKKQNQQQQQQQQQQKKKTLAGGVQIEDIKVGDGPVAKSGSSTTVYYVGKLKNGKKFDASTSGNGFRFRLGGGEVIKGWDVGVVGMKVGGKRRIVIPPAMGYGQKGAPPAIPPNSQLVFEVELKKVQ